MFSVERDDYLLVVKNPPEPFHVFISSNQTEFSILRSELKEILRKVRVYNAKRLEGPVDKSLEVKYSHELIVPEIVEYVPGSDRDKKINMAIGRSHIYVGIFGNHDSPISVREFNSAMDRGMTALVYFFTEPPRALKKSKGKSALFSFLMQQVKPRLLISGNYDSIIFKTRQDLEDEIVSDIIAEVTLMVRQYHGIQKAMTGFQT